MKALVKDRYNIIHVIGFSVGSRVWDHFGILAGLLAVFAVCALSDILHRLAYGAWK